MSPARRSAADLQLEGRPERLPLDDDHTFGLDNDPGALLGFVRWLRERGTPAAGGCALHLVNRIGHTTSWQEPWLGEVEALRAHPDPDIALAALLTGPAPKP